MFRFHDLFSILGYSYDTDCIYINGTGSNDYEFYIQLNRCGTLGGSDHNKKRDAKYKNSEPTVRKTILVVIFIVWIVTWKFIPLFQNLSFFSELSIKIWRSYNIWQFVKLHYHVRVFNLLKVLFSIFMNNLNSYDCSMFFLYHTQTHDDLSQWG